jgi:hypothetical protein
MTDKMMEDPFRDKLDGYASPVPDGAFARIMAERERRKRRPVGYWYLVPAILLLGGGLYMGTRHSEATVKDNASNSGDKSPALNQAASARLIPVDHDDGHAQPQGPQENESPTQTQSDAADKNFTLRSFPDASVNNHGSNSPSLATGKDHVHARTSTAHAAKSQATDELPSESKNEVAVSQAGQTGVSSSGNDNRLKGLSFPPLSAGLMANKTFGASPTSISGPSQRFCLPPCAIPGCPDFREYRNDWYIEAFASADLPIKTLQDLHDKSDFVQRKDSTEHMLLSFSAGLRVSKNLTNNLLLKTGFHYSQINERFDYKNENERRIVTVITIRTVIRGPGDTLLVRDTSQVETVGTRVKRTYNTYRNIDVPLILSWELRKPDFTIGLQGGLLFNLRSTFHGDMLDSTLVPMSQTARSPQSQIRTNWGLGLYAGVSFIKPVSPMLDVFAEPWYRVYLKNVAAPDAPFRQNMQAWGLQLGVRYRFNAGNGQHY